MTCPECKLHDWPDTIRGQRHCPQCHAVIALTKMGIRTVRKQVWYRHGHKRVTQSEYFTVKTLQGIVTRVAMRCVMCGGETDILHSIDGRIDQDGVKRASRQTGWEQSGPQDLIPATEDRYIPQTIRGRICLTCAVKYQAVEVGRENLRPAPNVRIGPFPHWNTRQQNFDEANGQANWAGQNRALCGISAEPALPPMLNTRFVVGKHVHDNEASYHSDMCGCPTCMRTAVGDEVMPVLTGLAHGAAEYRLYVFGRQVERRAERLRTTGTLRQLPRILWTILDSSALVGSRPIPDPRPVCPPMPTLPRNWVDPIWAYEMTTSGDTVRVRRHIPPCVQSGPAPNPRVACRHGLPLGQCALCAKTKR